MRTSEPAARCYLSVASKRCPPSLILPSCYTDLYSPCVNARTKHFRSKLLRGKRLAYTATVLRKMRKCSDETWQAILFQVLSHLQSELCFHVLLDDTDHVS
jgi:hypothetical protein